VQILGAFHLKRNPIASGIVLVIDDSDAVCTTLDVLLSVHGIQVLTATSPAEGVALLQAQPVDLVIQDMNFTRGLTSGEEGTALFRLIRHDWPELPLIVLTAWTDLDAAVELVKNGASDYIGKPWDDARLLTSVRNLLQLGAALGEARQLRAERAHAQASLADKYNLCGIVYASTAMHGILSTATQVAHADVPVLITGPNGAGKEVIADIIQANSSCSAGPYIKVNAGALPGELLESELFGSEPGAFTGARTRAGRFEAAHGGTLLLDEIGNLSLDGQAKLLRVLQTGEFQRLGTTETRRASVRVISASNSDLRRAVNSGSFREDLYYRLNVIELWVPPLTERRDDVLPLTRHFLSAGFELSASAERALLAYSWPGNVRELKNAIRRACLLSHGGTIDAATLALPHEMPVDRNEPTLDRNTIEQALERAHGVIAHAARELGLSRQSLYRRMERLGIKSEPPG
jgi:DNA-binding NtrC family response regulator